MANKIKDTDYLAISARVRAMETTLLTAERMERLLEARSDEEVSKLLQDCGYPELDAARPEAMDAALSQAREELLTDLGDGAPDPRYIDIFKLKYDYHNAKAILKAAAMGTRPGPDADGYGSHRSSGAEEPPWKAESWTSCPALCRQAVAEAKSVLDTTRDPQLSDIVLDRWMYRDMAQVAEDTGSAVPSGVCGDPDRRRQSPGADPDAADGKERRFSGGRSALRAAPWNRRRSWRRRITPPAV